MQQSTPASTAEFVSENGMPFKVEYFITNGKCLSDGADEADVFGITAILSDGSGTIDRVEIADVSESQKKVMSLVSVLAKNTVTPVTLKDVIEDYIALVA